MKLYIDVDGPDEGGYEQWYVVHDWTGAVEQDRVATFCEAIGIAVRNSLCAERECGYRGIEITAKAMALPEVRRALESFAEGT